MQTGWQMCRASGRRLPPHALTHIYVLVITLTD
jgi:hypothetical protein